MIILKASEVPQAVALTIRDARHWKRKFSGNVTPQVLRQQVLHRAIRLYNKESDTFQLNLNDYRNRFDETCAVIPCTSLLFFR